MQDDTGAADPGVEFEQFMKAMFGDAAGTFIVHTAESLAKEAASVRGEMAASEGRITEAVAQSEGRVIAAVRRNDPGIAEHIAAVLIGGAIGYGTVAAHSAAKDSRRIANMLDAISASNNEQHAADAAADNVH